MNLSDTDQEFRDKLAATPPDEPIKVILTLKMPPTSLPSRQVLKHRRITEKEWNRESQIRTAAIAPIQAQLAAIGVQAYTMPQAGAAEIIGTPAQIVEALGLEAVEGAGFDRAMYLLRGKQQERNPGERDR